MKTPNARHGHPHGSSTLPSLTTDSPTTAGFHPPRLTNNTTLDSPSTFPPPESPKKAYRPAKMSTKRRVCTYHAYLGLSEAREGARRDDGSFTLLVGAPCNRSNRNSSLTMKLDNYLTFCIVLFKCLGFRFSSLFCILKEPGKGTVASVIIVNKCGFYCDISIIT